MRRLINYISVMSIIVILIPFIMVKGCIKEDIITEKEDKTIENIKIKVHMTENNEVVEFDLEEYIKGVVAAEMPSSFELEALKAQSIASRTYAYGRINGLYVSKHNPHPFAHVCTDSAHCQAYIDEKDIKEKWGDLSEIENWNKITKAVKETENIIILYEGIVVNPVYHANSTGRTEDSEKVWGGVEVPYLKSVASFGGLERSGRYETIIRKNQFKNIIMDKYNDFIVLDDEIYNQIEIIDRSSSGRVLNIRVGNKKFTGTEFRSMFSLKSTNIEIKKISNDEIMIICYGHGHGVGMSQVGADFMAKNGSTYEEILKHYYTGVELKRIGE